MKRQPTILVILCLSIAWAAILVSAQADSPKINSRPDAGQDQSNAVSAVVPINQAPGALMRSKLMTSQKVMEGLLRRDFDSIVRGAQTMKRISEAAEWPRARDSVYEHFSQTFRRQCNQLEQMAVERNREGVTFTYLSMTNTCVQCHDYVRDSVKIAGPKEGDVRLIPSHWPQRVSKQ